MACSIASCLSSLSLSDCKRRFLSVPWRFCTAAVLHLPRRSPAKLLKHNTQQPYLNPSASLKVSLQKEQDRQVKLMSRQNEMQSLTFAMPHEQCSTGRQLVATLMNLAQASTSSEYSKIGAVFEGCTTFSICENLSSMSIL